MKYSHELPGPEQQRHTAVSRKVVQKILTTLTLIILCHVSQRKSEKFTKNRGAHEEPRFLLMNPFVFGRVLVA